jgi:hypothetical protein
MTGAGTRTTGGSTCTTGGGTCTTGAGAGTVSTSFVLEKHPERIPPIASDIIIDPRRECERMAFTSGDVTAIVFSNHRAIYRFSQFAYRDVRQSL